MLFPEETECNEIFRGKVVVMFLCFNGIACDRLLCLG
jgi:hypothetical protein